MFSLLITVGAAACTHIGLRHAAGLKRAALLALVCVLLAMAFSASTIPGGYWSGVYTLLSGYFLACLITPWIELLWTKHRAR